MDSFVKVVWRETAGPQRHKLDSLCKRNLREVRLKAPGSKKGGIIAVVHEKKVARSVRKNIQSIGKRHFWD